MLGRAIVETVALDVIAAWGRLVAARAQIISDQEQVRANKIALNGVKEEEKVGQRTLLDVLDAHDEFVHRGASRPARLHSFSRDRFESLRERGILFPF